MQNLGEQIVQRQEKLKADRANWETHWEEVAERVYPNLRGMFTASVKDQTTGEKRTEKMFDATPPLALERFAAAMESMLTPRNSRWHRLTPSSMVDPYVLRDREVRLWFDEVTKRLFAQRYSPRANYASQQHEVYMHLGSFGSAALFIDELDRNPQTGEGGLRYKACHLGNVFFLENHQGLIDTVYRKFPWTARQAYQKWGKGPGKGTTVFMGAKGDAKSATKQYGDEVLPDSVMKALEQEPEKEFEFIHCVQPRQEVDRRKADYRGMPWASIYVEVEHKTVLSEGGYNTFPYAISRYVTAPGEVYGRSPAMLALPSIKTLNEQQKTLLKQGHRAVDPVLLAHDDGALDGFSLKPGALNAGGVSADGRPLVHTLPTGNLAAGFEMMQQERNVINDAFLVSLFQILVDTPQMTATEVLERAREKGALLSPTMGRQQSEMLGPMIEREIDLLARQRMLPPMPQALIDAQGEFEIEYDSPLSRAQKAEEAAGLARTLEMVLPYVQTTGDMGPLDHFDWDEITPAIAEINAVPERWKRAVRDIQTIRQQRAQQAQQQQAIEVAPAVAGLAKAQQG